VFRSNQKKNGARHVDNVGEKGDKKRGIKKKTEKKAGESKKVSAAPAFG